MNWITTVIVDLDTGNHIKIGDNVTCQSSNFTFSGKISKIYPGNPRPLFEVEVDYSNEYVKSTNKLDGKLSHRDVQLHNILTLNGKNFGY